MSDKRVQAVLTYAKLNQLIGQTEHGPIEAVVADPVKRLVQIIFSAPGSADGIEPWVVPFYALRSSPPSTHTSDTSSESTESAAGETYERYKEQVRGVLGPDVRFSDEYSTEPTAGES